jgi:hypothetical protein
MLGTLFFTFTLVLASRLARSRTLPVVIAIGGVVLQLAAIAVGDVGLAILQPQPPDLGEALADPTSPIAVAHEIARRNGTAPGRGYMVRVFPILPALLLTLFDARRRPLTAGIAFGLGLYAVNAVMFLRSPAFAHVHPDPVDALLAVVVTVAAAALSTRAAMAFEVRLSGSVADPRLTAAVPVTRRA